jgi:hypothetical protein
MQRLSEHVTAFPGLTPQALDNTNVTGRYVKGDIYRRLRATLQVGAMATTKTAKLELLQASDSAGTGAKAITGASATVTAEAEVNECSVDLTNSDTGDTVTVNGITYTDAAATSVADREFANAAGLVLCVNNATYGVPGVKASADTNVVSFFHDADDQKNIGPITLVTADVAGTLVPATVKAQVIIDLDISKLDLANDFDFVAAKVTTTATTTVAVLFDFYDQRYSPKWLTGAEAPV